MRRLVVALALLLAAPPAGAAEPGAGVAVLMPRHDAASVTVAQAQAFREAIAAALGEAHLAALDLKEVDRRLAVADLSCDTKVCMARRSKLLNTRFLLGGRLERVEQTAGWALALWLYDVRRGSTVATLEDRCEQCTGEDAVARARPLTVRLLQEAVRTRGARVEVRSRPSGAEVRIDGELAGVTDMTFGVEPGEHVIQVVHKDTEARRKYKIRVGPGRKVVVDAELRRGAGAVSVGSINAGTWKWVSLAIGLAGVGAGAALWAVDGKQTCDRAAEHFQCPEHYDTLAPGIGLVAAGAVVLAGAALLFFIDATAEGADDSAGERAGVAPWLGRKSGGVTAAVTF